MSMRANKKNWAGRLTAQQQFLIRFFIQLKDMEKHKYLLSTQRGHEVDLEECMEDWVAKGHADRFAGDFSEAQESIYSHCSQHCEKNLDCSTACALTLGHIQEQIEELSD